MKSHHALKSFVRFNKKMFICCIAKVLINNYIQRSLNTNNQISAEHKMSLSVEFKNYLNMFSDEDTSMLSKFSQYKHSIKLMSGQKLSYELLYTLSEWELVVLWEYLDTALVKGWIQLSTSLTEVSILFMSKKDRRIRLYVNYRGLNKIIIKNYCSLPLISKILDWMISTKCFTKLNLQDAFHQIQIKRKDEWKTAFYTCYDHFEYMIMSFNLINASAIFQSYINTAL